MFQPKDVNLEMFYKKSVYNFFCKIVILAGKR